jgi:MFS family permease
MGTSHYPGDHYDDFLTDVIAAVLELGYLFGTLGAGVFVDRVSRRLSIAFACGMCSPPFDSALHCIGADWLLLFDEAVFYMGSALQTWATS